MASSACRSGSKTRYSMRRLKGWDASQGPILKTKKIRDLVATTNELKNGMVLRIEGSALEHRRGSSTSSPARDRPSSAPR